jgi:hypothetical protein
MGQLVPRYAPGTAREQEHSADQASLVGLGLYKL